MGSKGYLNFHLGFSSSLCFQSLCFMFSMSRFCVICMIVSMFEVTVISRCTAFLT